MKAGLLAAVPGVDVFTRQEMLDRTQNYWVFGTGAGITVGSDPRAEWDETELKAARLLAAAVGTTAARRSVTTP